MTKTDLLEAHLACPCGLSSDAYSVYKDGHGYCFSCSKYFGANKITEVSGEVTYAPIDWRGVSKEVMGMFNVYAKFVGDTPTEIGFPYQNNAVKIRSLSRKEFWYKGEASEATLFGKVLFNAGSNTSITITEGELDALSVFQMLGGKTPVVSVPSASNAKKACRKEFEYLNSFERIYLCFDNDDPGQKAAAEVANIFDVKKVFHVPITTHKDPNDFLTKGETQQFKNAWANAKRYLPDGIVSSFKDIEDILNEAKTVPVATYPFSTLQDMTYGIREGEVVLVTAPEGVGKTEFLRAIEHHLLHTTDSNIGILHLEDDRQRTIQGIASYQLGVPCHLPDSNVSTEEVFNAYKAAVRVDDRVHIYTHFGSDDPDVILERIRFLTGACDCKYIFFDHISIVVSGLEETDERKKLDYLSTRLKMLAQELKFTLFIVSHVNDNGQTRGSRNISKIADLRIDLSRDPVSVSDQERNTTVLLVTKNRFSGKTGQGGKLYYDSVSSRLMELRTVDADGIPPVEASPTPNF